MEKKKFFLFFLIPVLFLIFGCSAVKLTQDKNDFNAGVACFNRGDYENAVVLFEKAVLKGGADVGCHMWLGRAYLERDLQTDLKSAIVEFKAAEEKSSNREDVLLQIRDVFFEKADQHLSDGDDYMESGCYMAYTENFDKEDVEALIKLGRIFGNMGDLKTGLHFAKRAYEVDPENQEVVDLINDINPL